jgi:hypothetical protein
MEPAARGLRSDDSISDAFTPAPELMWAEQIHKQIAMITGLEGWCDAKKASEIEHDVCSDFTDGGSFPHIGPCAHDCVLCYINAKGKRTQADQVVNNTDFVVNNTDLDTRCEFATFPKRYGFEPSAKQSIAFTAQKLTTPLEQFWSAKDTKAGAGAGGGAAGGAAGGAGSSSMFFTRSESYNIIL